MGDCRSGRCSDRSVIVQQPQYFQYEMPQRSSCPGGSCAPRVENWQTLNVPPAPYSSFSRAGGCAPAAWQGDANSSVLQPFDKTKYDNSVRNNFDFTEKDYAKALSKAAKEGKPLVIVFASDRTPGAMNAAGDNISSAKGCTVGHEQWSVKGNAVFLHVDSDKAASNPELSKLMSEKGISGDRARTIIYNAALGSDGQVKAVPTELNNDRPFLSGSQLAADLHHAKDYSRPLNVSEKRLSSDSNPSVAPPAPAAPFEKTEAKQTKPESKPSISDEVDKRLAEKTREMEKLQKELDAMKKEMELVRKQQGLSPKAGREEAPMPKVVDAKPPAKVTSDSKPEAPKPQEKEKAKGPIGIDILKPDAAPKKDAASEQMAEAQQRQENFKRFLEVESRRLSGAVATIKDDHPTATSDTTKWLREQNDMNLLADRDIRAKLNDLGTYWRTSGRRSDEDANMQKRAEQWQDVRIQAGNSGDPNHASKQYMLYEFMTGLHTDGGKLGSTNETRVSEGAPELRTNRLQMQIEAAEALTKVVANPSVSHELSARLIADGLNNKRVPVEARIKLLDAIEPLSRDTKNKYLDGHSEATAVAMVVRAMLTSHNEKESNGDFQRAAMDKLVKMRAVDAYSVIDYLSRESGSDKTREHARNHLAKLLAGTGK